MLSNSKYQSIFLAISFSIDLLQPIVKLYLSHFLHGDETTLNENFSRQGSKGYLYSLTVLLFTSNIAINSCLEMPILSLSMLSTTYIIASVLE